MTLPSQEMDPSKESRELIGEPMLPVVEPREQGDCGGAGVNGEPMLPVVEPEQMGGGRAGINLSGILCEPFLWIRMLCGELNGTFVLGVVIVYGLSQGFSGAFLRVVSDYYWKDVQKVQPAEVQMFIGLYSIPLVMKPLWGILTDVVPVRGYHRRPYFIIAGILGISASITVAAYNLPVGLALLCLIVMTGHIAIADVTIDACIARNSKEKPQLAPDMQSLCGLVSSFGALVGYSISGVFVRLLGPQVALGLIAIPAVILVVLGFVIYELRISQTSEKRSRKVLEKVGVTVRVMAKTIQFPQVWKPSFYMFMSMALSISTAEGQFYWFTDHKAGPAFSKELVGIIYAVGSMANIVGVVIYHKLFKKYTFRSLMLYAQLLYGVSGMLDLLFVLRWNLKLHIPDFVFVVFEECCSRIITRIRWMPMMVLSTKMCPDGIEGTFFALLMCIDSLGALLSKTGGGLVLHALHVTRNDFDNLWLAILIRNTLRIATLGLIFLVPNANPTDVLLPPELVKPSPEEETNLLQLAAFNEEA